VSAINSAADLDGSECIVAGFRIRNANSIVFAVILAVFVLQYATFLIHWLLADRIIKIVSLALLFFGFKTYPIAQEYRKIFWCYAGLFAFGLVGSWTQADKLGVVQAAKYIVAFLVLPAILRIVPGGKRPPQSLLKMPLPFAALFSIQCLILFLVIYYRIPLKHSFDRSVQYSLQADRILLQRYDNMKEISFGVLGYANAIDCISTGKEILRAQSWFLEPSKFGGFLLYPLFVSLGFFFSTRKRYYLVFHFLCLLGILITFSLAAFFGGIDAALFLAIFRPGGPKNNKSSRSMIVRVAVALICCLVVNLSLVHMVKGIYKYRDTNVFFKAMARIAPAQTILRGATSPLGTATSMLAMEKAGAGIPRDSVGLSATGALLNTAIAAPSAPAASDVLPVPLPPTIATDGVRTRYFSAVEPLLARLMQKIKSALDLIARYPCGVGFGDTGKGGGDFKTPNAFLFWVITGGVPATVLILLLYWRLFIYYCLPLLASDYAPYRAVGAGFISITIQELSYGTWLEPYYLFCVATMLLCAQAQRSGARVS
jgi:hypothetical protein